LHPPQEACKLDPFLEEVFMLRRISWIILIPMLLSGCGIKFASFSGWQAGFKITEPAIRNSAQTESIMLTATNTVPFEAILTKTAFPPLAGTPIATASSTAIASTPTPTAPAYEFQLQSGSPVTTTNFLDASSGCNWAGVAGQVFSADGQPVSGLVVKVEGTLNNRHILAISKTGSAEAVGPGGYQAVLQNEMVKTPGEMQAQLFDKDGKILSARVDFLIPAECSGNLVVVNFISVFAPIPTPLPTPNPVFFPILQQGDH
jgi:hypothetical protein